MFVRVKTMAFLRDIWSNDYNIFHWISVRIIYPRRADWRTDEIRSTISSRGTCSWLMWTQYWYTMYIPCICVVLKMMYVHNIIVLRSCCRPNGQTYSSYTDCDLYTVSKHKCEVPAVDVHFSFRLYNSL